MKTLGGMKKKQYLCTRLSETPEHSTTSSPVIKVHARLKDVEANNS